MYLYTARINTGLSKSVFSDVSVLESLFGAYKNIYKSIGCHRPDIGKWGR